MSKSSLQNLLKDIIKKLRKKKLRQKICKKFIKKEYSKYSSKNLVYIPYRDVTTGATGATVVAPKFSDTLTLARPRGADSAHHRRGRS